MEFLKASIFLISFLFSHDAWTSKPPFIKLIQHYEKNECKVTKNYLLLTEAKREKLNKSIQNFDREHSIIKRFNYTCPQVNKNEISKGEIFILSRKIRTHYQTVAIDIANKTIKSLEIVSFDEPLRYKAPIKWITHFFHNKKLQDLSKIDGLTGATLTAQSIKQLGKEALSLSQIDD